MSIPVMVLLGFALWTLLLLVGSVGVYRWSLILSGRAELTAFPADQPHGADWYRRSMRAHANCVENLPVYTAIVAAAYFSNAMVGALATPALLLIAARILQSVVHVGFRETNTTVAVRFSFFLIQWIAMMAMAIIVMIHA